MLQVHVQDLNIRDIPRSTLERAMHRRQAIGVAVMAALGLILNDAGRHLVNAAQEEANSQAADSSGRKVVRVARKYEGAKYKSGGASPKGFDCSGFTWYVYKKAADMDISRGVEEQWRQGRSVARGKLQPGDLVFFRNTFERGLSHVGIFIRKDKFIHAENEKTGVVTSSLESDYYSKHYAGARRLL
jgi:cell wall-associated NlpC family hydrolase